MNIDLLILLEGYESMVYEDTDGNKTVGIGFNMDAVGARETWKRLHIPEYFSDVYYGFQELSEASAEMLARDYWATCEQQAERRAEELELNYNAFEDYKRFILADIAYNTGSVSKWYKVFVLNDPKKVLLEARRKPHKFLDNRVAKIGNYFGIISSVDEAKELGLEYTTNI